MHRELYLSLATYLVAQLATLTGATETKVKLTELFRDDFNTDDFLNTSQWTVADRHTASQLEVSYYMKDNAWVRNEYLVLHLEQEYHQGCNFTSARVDTNTKFTFLYGEVEWRAKLPGGPEFYNGLWLAKPASGVTHPLEFSPPAISFIENAGINSQRLFHSVNHLEQVDYDVGIYTTIYLAHKPLAFHVYKLIWTNVSVEWFIDGNLVYWVRNATKIPQVPLQIVMNIVVGGVFCQQQQPVWTGEFAPRQMLVDYVVVRQNVSYTEEDVNSSSIENTEPSAPGYFLPVVGTLSVLLMVCIVFLIAFVVLQSRQRYRELFFGERL